MTAAWTELWSAMSISSSAGWQNYDIYTALGIPKGSIAHIVMFNAGYSTATTVGVRTDGSSLERKVPLFVPDSADSGVTQAAMYVKVDSSTGLIETYASDPSVVAFYCSGYWTGVDFTELFNEVTTGNTAAWVDWDVGALGVPDGSICSVMACNYNTSTQILGIRSNGSALDRSHTVQASRTASAASTFTICVNSNASDGLVEIWNATSINKYALLGYFGTGLYYVETVWTFPASGTSYTWTDWNTGGVVPANAVADIMIADTRSFATEVGARVNGSSLERRWAEGNPGSYRGGECLPTAVDASGIYEIYEYDYAYCRNGPYGYYTTTPPPTVATFSPSANTYSGTSWSNPTYAYSDNTQYATSSTNNANNTYSGYGVTGSGTVDKVEINGFSFVSNSASTNKLRIAVSWDGGTTWSSNTDLTVQNTSTPTDKWVDVTAATSWDWDKLANLRVKITYVNSGTARTISLDWLPVRVTSHEESGPTEITVTDAVAFGEGIVLVKSIVVIEGIGAGDAVALGKSLKTEDGAAAGDAAKLVKSLRIEEGLGAADVIGPRGIKLLDSIAAGDAVRMVKSMRITDAVALGDLLKLAKAIIANDGVGLGEAVKMVKSVTTADAIALFDSPVLVKALRVAETIEAAEAAKLVKSLRISDAAAFADLIGPRGIRLQDGAAFQDAPKLVKSLKATDAAAFADLIGPRGIRITDAAAFADAPKLVKSLRTADSAAFADVIGPRGIKLLDALALGDAAKLGKALVVAEGLAASDAVALVKALQIGEILGFADVVIRTIVGGLVEIIVSDSVALADTVALTKALKVADGVAAGDGAKLSKAVKVAEGLGIADSAKLAKALQLAEAVGIQDAVKLSKSLVLADAVAAAEVEKITKRLIVGETVRVEDVASLVKAIRVADAIALTDEAEAILIVNLVLRLTRLRGLLNSKAARAQVAEAAAEGTSGERVEAILKSQDGDGEMSETVTDTKEDIE